MSYKYMLLDSRGAPVAQGVSEDGPEKNVWQLRIAHGDIKRVLGHEYISLVGTSEQFPAMEGRIVRCRDNLVSVECACWGRRCAATCACRCGLRASSIR